MLVNNIDIWNVVILFHFLVIHLFYLGHLFLCLKLHLQLPLLLDYLRDLKLHLHLLRPTCIRLELVNTIWLECRRLSFLKLRGLLAIMANLLLLIVLVLIFIRVITLIFKADCRLTICLLHSHLVPLFVFLELRHRVIPELVSGLVLLNLYLYYYHHISCSNHHSRLGNWNLSTFVSIILHSFLVY